MSEDDQYERHRRLDPKKQSREDNTPDSMLNDKPVLHQGILDTSASTSAGGRRNTIGSNIGRQSPTKSNDNFLESTTAAHKKTGFFQKFMEGLTAGLHSRKSRKILSGAVLSTEADPISRMSAGRLSPIEQHKRTGASTPSEFRELQRPMTEAQLKRFVRVIRLRSFRMHQRRILRRADEWDSMTKEEWLNDTAQGYRAAEDGNCLADAQLFEDHGDGVFLHEENDRLYFKGIYAFTPEQVWDFESNRAIIDAIDKYGTIAIAQGYREIKADRGTDLLGSLLELLCAMFRGVDDVAQYQSIINSGRFREKQKMFDDEYNGLLKQAHNEREVQVLDWKVCLEYARSHMHHTCSCQMPEHVDQVSEEFPSERHRPVANFATEPRGGLYAILG
jgi:hypothetical protein